MCVRVSTGMRELADNRAEMVGLARFFRNPRVTADEILRTAAARTGAAAAGRHVLLIEDTSEINYQAKDKRKRGLGRVGNGADVGLFVYPALAVDAEGGAVLGLASATIWRRTRVKEDHDQSLPIEEKESHRWIATALKARTFLSTAALVTLIADREADIYELFARVPDEKTHVLVRAARDRALADVGGRMLAKIAAQPEAGRVAFDLPGRPGRTARQVALAVRFCPVTLRQPQRGADRRDPPELRLNLVEAREIDPPPGEEPIMWRLLTTHPASTLAEAAWIIDLYRCRWIVEQLFRTLKSQGLDLENSFLSDGDALERLAATALIAAASVMQLVQGRGEAGATLPASRVFSPAEISVLEALARKFEGKTEKQKNPHPRHSLAWAAWSIARAGGWNGYASERPPGPITFARGLRRFHAIMDGFALAANNAREPHRQPPESNVCAR
ncbi:MAG TPA: IS4 family transposase [Methylocystis sp.]|nr:IS4 family transposase [Methylocystis sp.]